MSNKKKVMVIGHEASLSGAPILLLNLFKLLIERGVIDVQFVIRRGGPLVEEYRKLAPVIILKPQKYGTERTFLLHFAHFIDNKVKLLLVLTQAFFCDYFFFNTVVNGKLLRWFRLHNKPVITYVHELEQVIDFYLKQNDAVLPLSVSKLIAFPSNTTKELLISKYKTPADKLKGLKYYFPFAKSEYDANRALKMRESFRKKYGILEADFVVGAVGAVTERKGVDLFINVCEKVVLANPLIKFVWIGSFKSSEQELELHDFIKERHLTENLIFTGPLDYDIYNFSPFNILFLSSREDTYPLVALEAAIMKVPTICFSGSGGIVEFIGNDAGWIVEGFLINQAASKIIELQETREVVRARGSVAFDKVISLHCNGDRIVDQYNSLVEAISS
jgi:glycosyltransferase involved in cell wall biosynthesis